MRKCVFIYSFKESSWVSCQKIVSNLRRSYALIESIASIDVNYSNEMLDDKIDLVVNELIRERPDALIFLDHQPHPVLLLTKFFKQASYKPKVIFHIYGDFTLFLSEWLILENCLKGISVDFIVASEAQKKLIMNFLDEKTAVEVCPFLVKCTEFKYSPQLRSIQREKWQLSEEDIVFVYTGRLSYQKNIHKLLIDFSDVAQNFNHAHLYLYGNFDNLGDPFLNKWEVRGEYFRKVSRIFEKIPSDIRKRIHFMGHVQDNELRSIYQGADYLVNLSTHNDEDFGMSIAESLCSGLPVILTEWAGFMGFRSDDLEMATLYVPVRIGKRKKIIAREIFKQILNDVFENGKFLNREVLSEKSLGQFSIEAGSLILKKNLEREDEIFVGYADFFRDIVNKKRLALPEGRYMTCQNQISPLYKKIYSAYVREN